MNTIGTLLLSSMFYACTDIVTSDDVRTTVEKSAPEQVVITLQAKNSPLQTEELTQEDLPQVVTAQLNDADKTIALGNVLRAPCLEEWSRGDTLNRSVQKGGCPKAVDWLNAVDSYLESGKEYQDVLFVMVSPGPFLPSVDANQISVILEKEQLNTSLLKGRIQFLLDKSMDVKLYVDLDTAIYEMSLECLENGHNLSERVEESVCFRNTTSAASTTIRNAIQAQQKPVWLIKGYRLSGFQSVEQLSRVLELP